MKKKNSYLASFHAGKSISLRHIPFIFSDEWRFNGTRRGLSIAEPPLWCV